MKRLQEGKVMNVCLQEYPSDCHKKGKVKQVSELVSQFSQYCVKSVIVVLKMSVTKLCRTIV